MTEHTDEDKKKVVCKAQATMKKSAWIHYTARMTDDSHIYVEIQDIE